MSVFETGGQGHSRNLIAIRGSRERNRKADGRSNLERLDSLPKAQGLVSYHRLSLSSRISGNVLGVTHAMLLDMVSRVFRFDNNVGTSHDEVCKSLVGSRDLKMLDLLPQYRIRGADLSSSPSVHNIARKRLVHLAHPQDEDRLSRQAVHAMNFVLLAAMAKVEVAGAPQSPGR